MMMDKQQREALIDELLVFMNDEIENHGCVINGVYFRFQEDGEDAIAFTKQTGQSYEKLAAATNVCISRQYAKGQIESLRLTEEGQGRAISADAAKHAPPSQPNSGDIHIGTLNANGTTQVGNHNTQQIENVFTSIVEQIDETDAPDVDKQEAKTRLSSFLEHPLAGTIVGMTPMAIKALCGGG